MIKGSYNQLQEIFSKIKNIENILSIISWDSSVIMPTGSVEARSEQLATLTSLIHEIISSEKTKELISSVDEGDLDDWNKANFREMQRIYKQEISIEADLKKALTIAISKSEMAWRNAKNENDFNSFAPYLKEVLNLTKQAAQARSEEFGISQYDALLQSFEPGLLTVDIEPIFKDLKEFLPNFISQVMEKQKHNKETSFSLPINLQRKIGKEIMKMQGFNFNKGRLDTSEHPFCGGISQDTRITTRYEENNFISGLMGIIHETGHAIYQQNLPNKWCYQPVDSAMGMATHESQSLIYENQIARSEEFLYFLNNYLKAEYKLDLNHKDLYKTINKVSPSFIRVDADEVTYPAHIILRYNLEQMLFSGDLKVEDLPEAWGVQMQDVLGITPKRDKEGCLQDIHWPMGAFGYFPCYLVGAIMASQLYGTLDKEISENRKLIAQGKFVHIKNWLNQNIHQYGSKFSLQELLVKATGKTLSLEEHKSYLKNKFLNFE